MSVFGSHSERQAPASTPERRPAAPDFSYEAPVQQPVAPRAAAEPARKASVLGKTLVFRGELWAEEDLVLQGRVEGAIHHTRSLTVGVDGVVVGDIHAASIVVEGTVEGNLYGSASVLIGATAKVQGNIVAPRVGIREGAQFNGAVDMSNAQAARRPVQPPNAARPAPSPVSPAPNPPGPAPSAAEEHPLNERVVDRMLQR